MEDTSKNPYDFFKKGLKALQMGKNDEAIRYLDRVTSIDPENEIAWFHKGRAWFNKGFTSNTKKEYDEAIRCFDRATSIDPDFVDAWYNKAEAYDEKRETSEAKRCWGKSFSDESKELD